MTESKKDTLTLKRKLEKNDDSGLSKNFGESIRHRKRVIHDKEMQQELEDAIKEMQQEAQRQGFYDDFTRNP